MPERDEREGKGGEEVSRDEGKGEGRGERRRNKGKEGDLGMHGGKERKTEGGDYEQ